MATYTVNNGANTYNLPDEGTTFRATGDVNQDAVYQIKNGQLSTLAGRTNVAATDLRAPDGSIIKAGQAVPTDRLIDAGYKTVDPNFRGGWSNPTSGGQNYTSQTGTDYNSLAEFNMADLQTVLSRNNGVLPAMSKTEASDPAIQGYVNPNAANPTTGVQQSPAQAAQSAAPSTQPSPFGAAYGSLGGPNTITPQAAAAQAPGATPGAAQAAGKPALSFNGSIVDLLNSAGVDSSLANRQLLAQQYGMQGYTGNTAAQQKELADKFLAAYNSSKGTTAPQTGAEATTAVNNLTTQNSQLTQQNEAAKAEAQSFDVMGSMNPVQAQIFNQLSQLFSTTNTQQTLTDNYKSLYSDPNIQAGIPGESLSDEQLKMMDLKRVMEGTSEDIANEITKSGGFATASQVLALTEARNKTLLKTADRLQDSINLKQDYIDNVVNLTKADRAQVSQDLSNKLGISSQMITITNNMENAARDNLQNLASSIGYDGLARLVQNNPGGQAQIESSLNLPKGALSNPSFLQAATTNKDLTTQVVEANGRKMLVTFDKLGNPTNSVDLGSATTASAGTGGLTPGQVNAFNSIVSKYNSSPLVQASDRTAVLQSTIANIKKDPSNAAQQLNLAYSYVQALDTYQSAVREGELGLVNSIDSKIGQLNNSVQQMQNGQIVRPEVALQIANAAQTIVDTINSAAKTKAQSFKSQANVVGLGPYWDQYVSGFNQGYNAPASSGKGNLTSSQYVEQSLNNKGISYQSVLDQAPIGQIGVIDNNTGQLGYIPAEEFNSSIYTRI